MTEVLPDSKGGIRKILFHQTACYRENKQIRKGLFESFLKGLNRAGVKPEVYVFSTYRNYSEKIFLDKEAKEWKPLVKSLGYVSINVDESIWSNLPYAQDIGIVLNSGKPAVIINRSFRYKNMQNLMSRLEGLLLSAGLGIIAPNMNFNLEGGFVYACSNLLLYSNPEDQRILETFRQTPIFVENTINRVAEEILNVLSPGIVPCYLPQHIDVFLSVFEKENCAHIFYVNFEEPILSSPDLRLNQRHLLKKRLNKWKDELQKTIEIIGKHFENFTLHEMPGFIDFEEHMDPLSSLLQPKYFTYSGVNLLFHSEQNNDYAFYLKFPTETEQYIGVEINKRIESVLKKANIIPIAIAGYTDDIAWLEIMNSAGPRCLFKVLERG